MKYPEKIVCRMCNCNAFLVFYYCTPSHYRCCYCFEEYSVEMLRYEILKKEETEKKKNVVEETIISFQNINMDIMLMCSCFLLFTALLNLIFGIYFVDENMVRNTINIINTSLLILILYKIK